MPPTPPYQRMLRPVGGAAAYTSLWRGTDHLLLVSSSGFSESYQRIQYTDVMALLIKPSDWRMIWNIILGAVALIFLLVAVVVSSSGLALLPVAGAILTVILVVVNSLLGPGCKLYLATRVQTVQLPVRRRRRALRCVEQLKSLVGAAQGRALASVEIAGADRP